MKPFHIIHNELNIFHEIFYLINEKILRLEIPMKNVAAMTEGQAPQQLKHKWLESNEGINFNLVC